MNNLALAAVTALAMLVAGGCSVASDKSGGAVKPTTLVMASNDGTDPSSRAIARFVELVDTLSDGRLQVELSQGWAGKGEQRVLEDVAAGKAALGWSGTRAFDLIDADGFQPLHAPFLIRSYEAERAVVGDSVAHDMLATLDGTGLTGLALLGDELRIPAAQDGPLLDADDFDDLAFGVMASKIQATAISNLGARVTQFAAPGTQATFDLEGFETMWWTYAKNEQQIQMPFVTANAALWPRTSVIVANTDELDGLDRGDRDVLMKAATEAAQWSLEHADDHVDDEMAVACRLGARIATATPAQLAALDTAARPTYDSLRADPERSALLARVERLVRGAGPSAAIDVPASCSYRPGEEGSRKDRDLPEPLTHPGEPGGLPAGTYRYSFTADEINAGGHMTPDHAKGNAGVWTWTVGDGRWSYDIKPTSPAQQDSGANHCEGYYDVHGHEVDFTTVTELKAGLCAPGTWKADWRQTGDDIRMDVTTDGQDLDFLFGAKLWERID